MPAQVGSRGGTFRGLPARWWEAFWPSGGAQTLRARALLAPRPTRQLPGLAQHHERHLERERHGGAEHKPARLEAWSRLWAAARFWEAPGAVG
jgi:hypothetical protein